MTSETEIADLRQRLELVESTLAAHRLKSSNELERMSTRLQESHERWEGQKVRIDRILGTCDDLLKRFEAWKTVGNEMGEQVNDHAKVINTHTRMFDAAVERFEGHADRLDGHDERLGRHYQMLTHFTELANTIKTFMREVQQILGVPDSMRADVGEDGHVGSSGAQGLDIGGGVQSDRAAAQPAGDGGPELRPNGGEQPPRPD